MNYSQANQLTKESINSGIIAERAKETRAKIDFEIEKASKQGKFELSWSFDYEISNEMVIKSLEKDGFEIAYNKYIKWYDKN